MIKRDFIASGLVTAGQLLEIVGIADDDVMVCRGWDQWVQGAFDPVGLCYDHVLDGDVGVAIVQGHVLFTDEIADQENITFRREEG